MESAIRQAAAIHNESQKKNGHVNVFKVNNQEEFSCFRFQENTVSICPFINKECFYCENKGYMKKCVERKPLNKCLSTLFEYRYGNAAVRG